MAGPLLSRPEGELRGWRMIPCRAVQGVQWRSGSRGVERLFIEWTGRSTLDQGVRGGHAARRCADSDQGNARGRIGEA